MGIYKNRLIIHYIFFKNKLGEGIGFISDKSYNLIIKLLEPDYKKRLGSKGFNEIKNHEFFDGIDWDNIRKTEAPIKPFVKDIHDLSNFEKNKFYADGEKTNPFFGNFSPKNKNIIQAKKMLFSHSISLNRFDLLDAENQKIANDIEETK